MPVVLFRVTASPPWSASTWILNFEGIWCDPKHCPTSGYFFRYLIKRFRSASFASVGDTTPRARFFTACPMSSLSWDKYAARIVAERYRDASLLSSSGLRLSNICWSADFLTSGDSTPFAFSKPNAWIKRSTCLRLASITIDPLPFFLSTRINRFSKCASVRSPSSSPRIPRHFSS